MMRLSAALRLIVAAAAILGLTRAGEAAQIRMLASNAVKEAYLKLVPQFEKQTGHIVKVEWLGTNDIIRRINAGDAADIAIAPSYVVDDLIQKQKLAAGSRMDVARSTIGVAIRPGTPKPDLTSGETLKQSLLASKAIIISSGPSGVYFTRKFQEMGIAEAIRGKLKQLPPGGSPGEALARGEGDIGFTQVSELLAIKGIEYLGPVPADIQQETIYSAGLHPRAQPPAAARALLQFVTGAPAVPVLTETGLKPR
jgi:molybdate transport system substrate-binding protein